jgi:hypothetical protein
MLALGLAVFSWGLQAKLSLYASNPSAGSTTVAKIIQDGQVNKRTAVLAAVDRTAALLPVRWYRPAPMLQRKLLAQRHLPVLSHVFADNQTYPPSLFFRPPPVSL